MSKLPPVVHRNIALMLCDSSAVLTETLHQLVTEDIPFTRLGDRGFVAPAYHVDKIRQRLKEKAIYPAIIGEVVSKIDELEDVIDDFDDETEEDDFGYDSTEQDLESK